jgi:flavorubredoxin
MSNSFKENIDWVGYVDWNMRDFHSYDSEHGTTYNAYLVRDEKTALIDTVKPPHGRDLLKRVSALTELSRIDYIICNHAELDHAGELPMMMKAMPNATLICNKKCSEILSRHFDLSGWKIGIVTSGSTIPLGNRTLQFFDTPMVHWPESMFTYIPEEKLLFSMDAFGQHFASSQRFEDEVGLDTAINEAKIYYANIILPYAKPAVKMLEVVEKLDVEMIATSHGVSWRKHIPEIIRVYHDWAVCKPKAKVLAIFDSMWDSTTEMASAILEGASLPGVDTKLIHIRRSNYTKIAGEIIDAPAIAFGSSTLNQGMMPMAGAVLTYLKGLRPTHKVAFAFGSYGWGKGGPKAVDEALQAMKWEIIRNPLMVQYRPTPEILDECRQAGRELGQKALEMAGSDH